VKAVPEAVRAARVWSVEIFEKPAHSPAQLLRLHPRVMTDTETNKRGGDLAARASRLNEIGEHYFVGWLVSAGFQRPEIMREIERVLHDIDNDPALRHCTPQEDSTAAVPAPRNPLAVVPHPEPKPARRLPFAARLLAAIFHRPRMAA
jgi:hypothetical protein